MSARNDVKTIPAAAAMTAWQAMAEKFEQEDELAPGEIHATAYAKLMGHGTTRACAVGRLRKLEGMGFATSRMRRVRCPNGGVHPVQCYLLTAAGRKLLRKL